MFIYVTPCPQADDTVAKINYIVNGMHNGLRSLCGCDITKESIAKRSFLLCSNTLSHFVTYRSQLSGTPEADSHTLISYIEDWVAGGPSIRVHGVLMKIDSECPVTISSFNDELCMETMAITASESPTSGSPNSQSSIDNTGAIIGGILVALTVIIALTVLLLLVWKGYHGDWLFR